jgi:hypothetical protein
LGVVKATAFALLLVLTVTDPGDAELAQGIALVRDGDFDRAVPRLDATIKRLEAKGGTKADLSQAHLYLGIAYLELEQEASAKARFREALRNDPKLRLDPRTFSPQTIRVFEATRAEMPPEKKKGFPVLLVAGGAAAAAGIAVAAGGGGGGSGSATTTTTPSSTTTTTTTTTTTLPAAECRYDLTPLKTSFLRNGGNGTCNVETVSGCPYNSEVNASWVQIQSGGSGTGPGQIRYRVLANNDRARKARIELRQAGGGVRCEIEQAGSNSLTVSAQPSGFASVLEVPDGRGQASLNGRLLAQGRGRVEGRAGVQPGPNLLEATLLAGRGAGTWRFDLTGIVAGSLRPIQGEVVLMSADSVTFRLKGEPGERVALAFVGED